VSRNLRVSAIALAVASGWALPVQAQSDDAALRQELAEMRAQMNRMAERIDTLEGQLGEARAKADAAQAAVAAIPPPTVTAKPATEVTWDGAPKLTGKDGWSFKPRGRMQLDVAGVNGPSGLTSAQSNELGVGTEFRRAYIGFDGTIPGGFGYRIEADLAASSVNLTDVYLTYKASPEITLTAGQHKPFWGLEEMTSDLFTSFMERSPISGAFGFERRIGASAAYQGKTILVQAGVFTDDAAALNSDSDNSYSVDGRVVFMPKIGDGQLHLGGSLHYRKLNDLGTTVAYSARPAVHTTDLRFINTGNIAGARSETGMGVEAAYIVGRFHATAEGYWQKVSRVGLADPTFFGGYGEIGMLLTDDVTAYKGGVYDRIRPKHPVGKGGMGALQVNARYDWLDLNDTNIVGGRQQTASLGLIWIPTDYVRFLLDYSHLWIKDAAVPAAGDRDYSADVLGMRAQFDF
jgi:phosphate-selective porin OprO/OprP